MGPDAQGRPFAILIALVATSLLVVVVGLVMHHRGGLRSRGAALVWAVLCIVPLFGAGAFFAARHAVDEATGETQSGVNEDPAYQGSNGVNGPAR